ncbi:MAG: hypothetical protein MUD08_14620 [Cytophagales bacterium]|jgi:hypothetical protein|nr:hypothetical protein [Cytophagales bacterium]
MKKAICILLLTLTLAGVSSCDLFLEEKPYIADNAGAASIIFVIPDTANLPAPAAGLQLKNLPQPSSQLTAGVFPVNGNADVVVQVSSSDITAIDVNALRVTSGRIERQPRGTLTVANREARFTAPLATLNFGGDSVRRSGATGSVNLEFVARTAAGPATTRFFTVRGR